MIDYSPPAQRTTSAETLTAEVQVRLKAFAREIRSEIEAVAVDLVELWAGDDGGRFPSDKASLLSLLRTWMETTLSQGDRCLASPPPWEVLLVTVDQAHLVRGFALVRRGMLRASTRFDGELAEHVLWELDVEFARVLEVRQRIVTGRLAALDRLSELGQLVASVGHELRNPLSAIEASAYILSRRLESPISSDPKVAKHLGKIRRNVDLANRVANALLSWAKQQTPRYSITQLRVCIDSILRDLDCPVGVCVELDIPEELKVWVDPDLMAVLVRNLVSNAIESLGGSGIVRILARQDPSGTSVVVSDDGPGVPEPDRPRIFELLHSSKSYGTGLGLPLCKRIALAHGGNLSLEPSECGASFRLWIPSRTSEAKDPVPG